MLHNLKNLNNVEQKNSNPKKPLQQKFPPQFPIAHLFIIIFFIDSHFNCKQKSSKSAFNLFFIFHPFVERELAVKNCMSSYGSS